MKELTIFQNEEFGSVRTLKIKNGPWFVGKDVVDILEFINSRKALSDHVDEEDKNTVTIRDGIRGNPNMTIINESGLYSLIFSSKLPKAKQFKRWVTSEVLPAIRKTGYYTNREKIVFANILKKILDILKKKCYTYCMFFYQRRREVPLALATGI